MYRFLKQFSKSSQFRTDTFGFRIGFRIDLPGQSEERDDYAPWFLFEYILKLYARSLRSLAEGGSQGTPGEPRGAPLVAPGSAWELLETPRSPRELWDLKGEAHGPWVPRAHQSPRDHGPQGLMGDQWPIDTQAPSNGHTCDPIGFPLGSYGIITGSHWPPAGEVPQP